MNYLVFDVGGSAIKYSLMNDSLEMIEKGSEKTPKDSLENFKKVIKSIYEKYKDNIDGIAMSLPGLNDSLEMIEKGSEKTPKDSLENFKKVIKSIYEKYKDNIDGIAMSLPGLINRKTNKMQIPGALEYNFGVDILSELKSVTTDRFTIENDAK